MNFITLIILSTILFTSSKEIIIRSNACDQFYKTNSKEILCPYQDTAIYLPKGFTVETVDE